MKKILFLSLALLMSVGAVLAQTLTVHGTITSASDGEALIGASVLEVGTGNGTITDFDGNFVLNVAADAQLQVSYVGFNTLILKAQAEMKIEMSDDQQLEEVVVTGYQVQRKADLTGAVSVVSAADLQNAANVTDPMSSLQGKIAGVTITPSGSPSGEAAVSIRGMGTFGNSTTSPLYVIDGVPTYTGLNSLNPSDIESMQVLKDAASASIYGSRAANGVIVITTKKGKKNDKINVDFNAGVTTQFYSSQSKMKLLDSRGYATCLAQAALNDGKDIYQTAKNYGVGIYPEGSGVVGGMPITVYNPATGAYENYVAAGAYGDGKYINANQTMPFSNTDWLDEMSRVGVTQSYDLSISRANDKSSQLISFAYKKAEGILKYTDFENLTGRINTSYNIAKWLTIGENLSVSYSDQVDCYPMENALKMSSIVPVYEEGKDGSDGKEPVFGGPVGGMSDRQNPMRELYHNKDNRLKKWRLFGNAFVNLTPIEGLLIRSNIGIEYQNSTIRSISKTFYSDVVNNATNSSSMSTGNTFAWTWSTTAQYTGSFGAEKTHHMTGLVGAELHGQNYEESTAYRQGYDVENYNYMWPDAGTGLMRVNGKGEGYRLASFFEKVDYNWDDRILASVTVRHDGSSRFGRNNTFGHFPAVQAGYRLSRDLDVSWLDDLKFRGSWGINGNQDIWNTARFGIYTANYGSDRAGATAYEIYEGIWQSGYNATQTKNDDLRWESTYQGNVGADFAFLHNSLYGSVEWYQKDVKDMLIRPSYIATYGEGGDRWVNGPSQRTRGMEFVLGYRTVTASGVSINILGNLDFFRAKVTYLPEATKNAYVHTETEDLVTAGKAYGSRVGYVCEGLFQSREEVLASGQAGARVGGLKYMDLNGDGRITAADRTWIYNPVPDASWGLNFELGYKGFDFTMFIQGVAGVQVYNDQKFQTDFWSITDPGSNKGARCLDAWTPDNTSSTIPSLTTSNGADEGRESTYYVENGSYAKLRKLQFGYSFQNNLLEKAHLSHARIYISGDNLATIKSKSLTCTDPENTAWKYPLATSLSMGLQIGF